MTVPRNIDKICLYVLYQYALFRIDDDIGSNRSNIININILKQKTSKDMYKITIKMFSSNLALQIMLMKWQIQLLWLMLVLRQNCYYCHVLRSNLDGILLFP